MDVFEGNDRSRNLEKSRLRQSCLPLTKLFLSDGFKSIISLFQRLVFAETRSTGNL